MKAISFWVPTSLCACISMLALYGSVIHDSKLWRPAFYLFLPLCFFLVGSITYRMHRELSRLRHRVGRLEQKLQVEAERESGRLTRPGTREPGSARDAAQRAV
jgi:hypothetical protein